MFWCGNDFSIILLQGAHHQFFFLPFFSRIDKQETAAVKKGLVPVTKKPVDIETECSQELNLCFTDKECAKVRR